MATDDIQSFRDLTVWQKAMRLAELAYRITASLPEHERYGMTAQIRRAAASIPANIAEGHGREGQASFIQFLRVAQGSLKELETHVLLAERVDLLKPEQVNRFMSQSEEVGKMLRSLIRSLQRKS